MKSKPVELDPYKSSSGDQSPWPLIGQPALAESSRCGMDMENLISVERVNGSQPTGTCEHFVTPLLPKRTLERELPRQPLEEEAAGSPFVHSPFDSFHNFSTTGNLTKKNIPTRKQQTTIPP